MALETMQKANLDGAVSDVHGDISKKTVVLDSVSATQVTFSAGAKWSKDLKDYAQTESCALPHVAYVLSGAIEIQMDDGSKQTFEKGDIMMLPPGHDAWTVGDEPCVFIEFSQGNNYYDDLVEKYHQH